MNFSSFNSSHKNGIVLGLMILLTLTMTSCGKGGSTNSIVSKVNLEAKLVEDDVYLGLTTTVKMGNLFLPALTLPILNPMNTASRYGEVMMKPTFDGKNEIGLSVNLTESANIPGGPAKLPNGQDLPIGGLDGVQLVELGIEAISSKVYLGLGRQSVLLGFAIAIKEFDTVSSYVGPVNIFPSFIIGGVKGVVGLFTSKDAGQSGLGFFVDLSSVISPEIINNILDGAKVTQEQILMAKAAGKKATQTQTGTKLKVVTFKNGNATNAQKQKAYDALNKMSSGAKKTLHLTK